MSTFRELLKRFFLFQAIISSHNLLTFDNDFIGMDIIQLVVLAVVAPLRPLKNVLIDWLIEVSRWTCYEVMNGGAKCRKWGGFGG